jgi:hypothetical protein
MKRPKTLIKIGAVLLIVVAAVLVVRAVLNFTEGRALTRRLAELKAKGVPLTAGEIASPCAEEENAARLWTAVDSLLTIGGKQDQGLLARTWKAYSSGQPLDPTEGPALRDLVARNDKALALLMTMGDKPCFLFRDPAQSLLEARLPSAVKMLQATRLLLFAALFRAEAGEMGTAVGEMASGLKFTPLVAREGTLMPFLIAVAQTRILANFLGDVCEGRTIADADLVRLMDALDPGPWRGRLAEAIRGERVFFVEAGELTMKQGAQGFEAFFGDLSILQKLGLWTIKPLLKRDFRTGLPVYEELEGLAPRPYYEVRPVLKAETQRSEKRPWYAYISKILIGNFEAAFFKEAQLEANILASRTGLACRLYKSRTGSYPERLDALVPGILSEVPIDPFTGQPLVYRRDGEGFIVYSLGSNEKDDGGRSTYWVTKIVMDKDDDLTWKEDR